MKKSQLIEMLEFIPDDYEVLANGNIALGVIKDRTNKSINIYSGENFSFRFPYINASGEIAQHTTPLMSKAEG